MAKNRRTRETLAIKVNIFNVVCMMAIPFFALGYLCKVHSEAVDTLLKEKINMVALFLILGVVNVVAWRLSLDETGLGLEMFASNYGNPVFHMCMLLQGFFVW